MAYMASQIVIGNAVVTKTTTPELMRVEIAKTRRAFAIARSSGLFRVPEILDYDEARGVAVFERLDITPVASAVRWGRGRTMLAEHLGTCLAVIHRELTLPDEMRIPLPAELVLPRDEVFIHGDLGLGNVCVGASWPPIVVLDWQMTPLCGGRATYGTRYFDLLWFIGNLILNPSARLAFGNPAAPAIRAFMASYFREAGLSCDAVLLREYATRLFAIQTSLYRYQILPKRKARALLPFGIARLEQFMDELTVAVMRQGSRAVAENPRVANDTAALDYRRSHLETDHAKSYHSAFANDPYRRMVWDNERKVLDEILTACFPNGGIRHLDFACGTGRILSHLRGRVQSSVGVDVSKAMLTIAKESNPKIEILEADLTRDDVLAKRKFNLITAFRFFPNAQPTLRAEAMRVIVDHLDDDGLAIFNNHMNISSTTFRLARLLRRGGHQGMSGAEVSALVDESGLEVIRSYHLCVLPSIGRHMRLPLTIVRAIESILSRIPLLAPLAENVVFVCRRTKGAPA